VLEERSQLVSIPRSHLGSIRRQPVRVPEFRSSAPILGSDGVKSLVSALHTGHDCDIA
jgi:hypothetical protein